MSADAGALSSPMLEQLTTQDAWSPASAQLQLTGQGLQLLPPSPCGPEPHASRQQSPTSRVEKKLNLGTQTPCFRLDKVCPFPQGIAHSHLIASDGASPLSLGRNTKHSTKTSTLVLFSRLSCEETKREEEIDFWTPLLPLRFLYSPGRIPFLWKSNGASPQSFQGEKKKKFWRTSSLLLLPLHAVPWTTAETWHTSVFPLTALHVKQD